MRIIVVVIIVIMITGCALFGVFSLQKGKSEEEIKIEKRTKVDEVDSLSNEVDSLKVGEVFNKIP